MIPQEPVVPLAKLRKVLSCDMFELITYAKDQAPYLPLPVIRINSSNGLVISRWSLSWIERLRILIFGDLYISQLTFSQPLQPIKPVSIFTEAI